MAREAPPSPPAASSRYSDERPAALSATPLSLNFEEVSGNVLVDDPTVQKNTGISKASQLLSSLTGSQQSYDLVEDDDYEDQLVTPRVELRNNPTTNEIVQQPEEDVPVRTASISRQLPLNHPRPDLQSLQGAYVKNVERLEESAERLSMTSSLEGELQRMKMEQRRVERTASASSQAESYKSRLRQFSATSNSIIEMNAAARSGGYSQSGYISSPIGSIKSPNIGQGAFPSRHSSKSSGRIRSLPEPEMEGRPLDFGSNASRSDAVSLDPRPPPSRSVSNASNIDRPGTSGSGDTFQQANTLFNDFDGVHYDADSFEGRHRQVSINRPPRARDSRAFKEQQPGEDMVYYPAPVPVMLNLPVRLSRMNWNDRERKRLQALSEMPEDMRKSAAWLAHDSDVGPANRQSMAKLPPQLRASAFFDYRGTEQNVQLKDGSAVATLDSILDAAAHAPVSAFTDHPIVGHLGKEVYGRSPRKSVQLASDAKTKRRSSIGNLLARKSSGNLSTELSRHGRTTSADGLDYDAKDNDGDEVDDEATRSLAPTSDELPDDENGENASARDSESDEDDIGPGFSVAPTTLLAELQMRKTQQKKRNRTAADGFPNGMHSTLLELDTVTQLQQKARKQKHVTLAWEDQEVADKENYDDEDVPLGLLFTEKQRQDHINLNRPMGLMEKREMEENEPLSMRRARLRGEPFMPPAPPQSGAQSLVVASQHEDIDGPPTIDLPGQDDSDRHDDTGETLAQRMKRLRDRKDQGSEFARDISSELGLNTNEGEVQPSKTPDVEETLGQRRKRLKEEALRNGGRQVSAESTDSAVRPALKPSRSLADILQSNPIGYQHPQASKTSLAAMQTYQQTYKNNPSYIAAQQASAMPSAQNVMQTPHANYMHTPSLGYPAYQYQNGMAPYMNAAVYNPLPGFGAQVPMNTNMNMNVNMGMGTGMGMNAMGYPYGVPGFPQSPMAFGMGPPLDQKQRATIDRWRQGIA